MPEMKNQFTGGKMNKDLDERIIPQGQYRDAMNIQVSTSEDSDVGTVQNILGNVQIPLKNFYLPQDAKTIACVSDEKNDTLYYLVWSDHANYIIGYSSAAPEAFPVFVDNKNVLEFNSNTSITGINIIDDMLLWTDNETEPKKINIERCKRGTPDFIGHTRLINISQGLGVFSNEDIETKHITVIKQPPKTYLKMNLVQARDPEKIYTGVITTTKVNNNSVIPTTTHPSGVSNSYNESSFVGPIYTQTPIANFRYDFSGLSTKKGKNTFGVHIVEGVDSLGEIVSLGEINSLNGITGWHHSGSTYTGVGGGGDYERNNIKIGTKVVIKPFDEDGTPPGLPLTDYVIKGEVVDRFPLRPDPNEKYYDNDLTVRQIVAGNLPQTTSENAIDIRVTAIDGTPPVPEDDQLELKYVIDLFDETEKLFEFKFPRFSYRYKYSDGEYSTFATWTQVAFLPGSFDYHPRKGYNLGMTNRIQSVELYNLITPETPKDVVSIDILFKDEPSPNIYVVDTIRKDDTSAGITVNKWNDILQNNAAFVIEKETINSTVPSNQLLRPWDNVPRRALAQDISGNRIIYGNYVQNYDLINYYTELRRDRFGNYTVPFETSGNYKPTFSLEFEQYSETVPTIDNNQYKEVSTRKSQSGQSIKSLREYQLGVVFVDKHGRETPVLSNESGTIKLDKKAAGNFNRLRANLGTDADGYPNAIDSHLKYFKFYIKETSGEYYNMAMDRHYDAEDGNIWLAFPSSDRNKIDEDTFLILKKGSSEDVAVLDPARYKVISISNEAPDFVKTRRTLATTITHGYNPDVVGQNGIFGNSIGDGPAQGRKQFEVNYKSFLGTPAAHLDEYNKGELYIEFANLATGQFSKRYRIASIEHDNGDVTPGGDPTSIIDVEDAKYYISLEDSLDADVNFITDDPTGLNSTKIENGTTLNIYKYEVTNSPKFDGRFFVKIYSDDVFAKNIGKSFIEGLDYRVVNSKKVYYMHPNHRKMHTIDLGDFLTDGQTSTLPSGIDNLVDDQALADWGYYSVREFASMALFFRRYARGTASYGVGNSIGVNYSSGNYKILAHLQLGNNTSSNSYVPATGSLNVDYQGEQWTPADAWQDEYGFHTANGKSPNTARGGYGYTHAFELNKNAIGNVNNAFFEHKTGGNGDKQARDTEVWFIDSGDYAGASNFIDGDLSWNFGSYDNPRQVGPTSVNPGNLNPAPAIGEPLYGMQYGNDNSVINNGAAGNEHWDFYSRTAKGIYSNTNEKHNMHLSFGGIMGAGNSKDSPSIFNVANWGVSSAAQLNPNYSDLEGFAKNINTGYKFRWKQDPTKQVYTIGDVSTQDLARHSSNMYFDGLSNTDYVGQKGIIANQALQLGGTSMAETLSFNLNKKWNVNNIAPGYTANNWNPLTDGEINGGYVIHLTCCDSSGNVTGTNTATGTTIAEDLEIYVTSITGSESNYPSLDSYNQSTLLVGMALESYTKQGDTTSNTITSNLGSTAQDYLVIRKIQRDPSGNFFTLTLGGYTKPLTATDHTLAITPAKNPTAGTNFKFVQVGMNGYSSNSEFNINTLAHTVSNPVYGAVTAVGYDIEFVEYIEPEEILSENPAVWETEPKEIKELDIYYEASPGIPMFIDEETVESALPINSFFEVDDATAPNAIKVVGYDGGKVAMQDVTGLISDQTQNASGVLVKDYVTFITNVEGPLPITKTIYRADNISFDIQILNLENVDYLGVNSCLVEFNPKLYNLNYSLNWHNCFSFGNGVESNRIRDNFNLPFIANGVKVSTTLEQEYKEEHRKYGLIYSGIYNSTSGVNNLNQFIQAEKITKDINPIYGSIQKLKAGWGQGGDLVALCEDRVLKILADKDALFNADGNTNVTATNRVLGQAVAYSGEYGISTNPESFASEAYRAYFTDKVRGKVMRLSMDGLTPISDQGMKDWFKDNLRLSNKLTGSYDDNKNEYNITLNDISRTVTYKEDVKGWVSFKSYVPEKAVSCANNYYTFNGGRIWKHHSESADRNTFYGIFTSSSLNVILNQAPEVVKSFNTLNYEGSDSKVQKNLQDNQYYNLNTKRGWYVDSILTNKETGRVDEFIQKEGKWFNYIKGHDVLHNSDSSIVVNQDNSSSWDQHSLAIQGLGSFDAISGCTNSIAQNYDPNANFDDGTCDYSNLSTQTLNSLTGCMDPLANNYLSIYVISDNDQCSYGAVLGCMDPNSSSYAGPGNTNNIFPIATIDDGFQCNFTVSSFAVYGCTIFGSVNFNPSANANDGSCIIEGCTDPSALNYNYLATQDDGSCVTTIYGCMDDGSDPNFPLRPSNWSGPAANYNPLATVNRNALAPNSLVLQACDYVIYAQGCSDPNAPNYQCITDYATYQANGGTGVADPDGCNFNGFIQDDGSCEPYVVGCTDPAASNYEFSSTATISPILDLIWTPQNPIENQIGLGEQIGYIVPGADLELTSFNAQPGNQPTWAPVGTTNIIGFGYLTIAYNHVYTSSYVANNSSFDPNQSLAVFTPPSPSGGVDGPNGVFVYDNNGVSTTAVDSGLCVAVGTPVIQGCTDGTAFNYDPNANVNNGTCIPRVIGCMNCGTLWETNDPGLEFPNPGLLPCPPTLPQAQYPGPNSGVGGSYISPPQQATMDALGGFNYNPDANTDQPLNLGSGPLCQYQLPALPPNPLPGVPCSMTYQADPNSPYFGQQGTSLGGCTDPTATNYNACYAFYFPWFSSSYGGQQISPCTY